MSNPCTDVWEEITQQKPAEVAKGMGILCLILNIFLPGIGSIVAGAMGNKVSTMIIGLLQIVTCWFILGWIWSVWWGILIFMKAHGSYTALT
mmetsp:Transcript_68433/g.142704  ORF Transcript_68433/g.142704 Transcript_68433/m.142704 type:complete len:92 (+) Transcript_68433:60-335(+)|eukprot:CAMPEP_0181323476 /NCGR_PEP_ID=MMETSP1101-20121128/19809_1 /TAXON_ID=46948 /ORGANISM="Rhodomonas abbreviata, Strain Caron Lab Isolate" /LENGTH=91 /DNA_ID=CAMNT_0023431513 /DNA_START=60 /DNA_END=335 /DNA_ORIENTATION=-